MVEFSHIAGSRAEMVDITAKGDVSREATAKGRIYLRKETILAIQQGSVIKGNVLATARVAATLAIKDTSRIIPLCHQIPIGAIKVEFSEGESWIETAVTVKTVGKTGVEMEALTGVSVALLTIWDMVKSAEKDREGQYPATRIEGVCVTEKKKETGKI
ncbi:MAG: cyclic pyranopterin monophosphate synthase MoaC [Methanomicrobiales archaeon]